MKGASTMLRILLLAGTSLAAAPLAAQTAPAADPATHDRDAPGDYHATVPADIVVSAPVRRDLGSALSGTTVLSGNTLVRELRPTIGETLARQPGVSATSFGPNASRPVLRGFQGDRVRILTDGIGSFDVSNTSVDHAVVINPLTAERIEVLRGPSALLFGSSAVGGVVNVIDKRIPRAVPDDIVHVDAIGTLGSAASERAGQAAADVAVTPQLVLHVDGSYLGTGDLSTGGHILSAPLRRQASASAETDIQALAGLDGKLPNSSARTWDVAGGAAVVTDRGNLGFSVSHYDSLYGVPVRYALEPGGEAEQVRLHLEQTREDLRAEVKLGGGFVETLRLRAGHADYRHQEIEESGEVGTTFYNDSYEARLELAQARRGGWSGAFGGQMMIRNFDVVGEEAFLPKNQTQQYGLFTLQQVDLGDIRAEGGARYEHSILDADAFAQTGAAAARRSFDAVSGSLGASYRLTDGWRIGVNGSRTERAPTAEELFADGPHAGTQAYEVGDPDLALEKSWGLEATLHGRGPGYTLDASLYRSWFDGYIYAQQSGALADGLPVFRNLQGKARYWGAEVQGSLELARLGGWTFVGDGLADYVHATVADVGPAPRIPPLRLMGGIEAQGDRIQGRVEVEHSFRQDRVADNETRTPGFTLVNASLQVQPIAGNRATTLILSANNIFDAVARRHASFLKDYAPLAGRDLRASVRLSF